MEKEGFIRCVNEIINSFKLKVNTISTDRHPSIKKLMKSEEYKHIKHQFDPWHLAKSILKKIMLASKKKIGTIKIYFLLIKRNSVPTLSFILYIFQAIISVI